MNELYEMVSWSNGSPPFLSAADVALVDYMATLDPIDLGARADFDHWGEEEWDASAPYNPSHPDHRGYCPGCGVCDRLD